MSSTPRYSMLDSMDIKCPRCGYENNPQFRFCAMCGASLRAPGAEDREADANARVTDYVPEEFADPVPPMEPMPVEPLISALTDSQKKEALRRDEQSFYPQPEDVYSEPPQANRAYAAANSSAPVVPDRPPASYPVSEERLSDERPPEYSDSSSRANYSSSDYPDAGYPNLSSRNASSSSSKEFVGPYSSAPMQGFQPDAAHGQRSPMPVNGPSFLGLAGSEDQGAEYLLEDEPSGGKFKVLALVLVLLAVGGLFWYWQRTGYPWASHAPSVASNANSGVIRTDNSGEEAPVATASHKAQTSTNVGRASGNAATSNARESLPSSAPLASSNLPENHPEGAANSANNGGQAEMSPEENFPVTTGKPSPALAPSARRPVASSGPSVGAVRQESSQPVGAADPAQDSLFLQGQRFLYGGHGVPANCAMARQSLSAAANNGNSKAESTLATMYATGHCVPRDLPLAYRWFARALHTDPQNTRLEQDVKIMWNQMSAQERQLALKNE